MTYRSSFTPMNSTNDFRTPDEELKQGSQEPDILRTLPPTVKVGELFCDRYEVTSYLGEGSMGMVYGCTDLVSRMEVAVKMFPPELSNNQEMMEQIRSNFQLVQPLKHDNIAALINLEPDPKHSGSYMLVMELAKGKSLQELIRKAKTQQRPFSVNEALPLLRQIASALDYAHAGRVVHRDVKPGNIIVSDEGKVFVLDFGIAARISASQAQLTGHTANTGGTPAYKSPEQWKARHPQGAMDQYALGVIAYEMLANALPFDSGNNGMLREAVLYETPERFSGVSVRVWSVLLKVLAKEPEERFESCTAFVESLAGVNSASGAEKVVCEQDYFEVSATLEVLEMRAAKLGIHLDDDDEFLIKKKSAANADKHEDSSKAARFLAEAVERGKTIIARCKSESEAQQKVRADERQKSEPQPAAESVKNAAPERTGEHVPVSNHVVQLVALSRKLKLAMVKIRAGSFIMGSREEEFGYDKDEKMHRITLTQDFWIGKYPVTQEEYEALMGSNPSHFKMAKYPVENVSWDDARAFCEKLNRRYARVLPLNYRFDLPTEAQWEYACRGGTETALNSGKELTSGIDSCFNLDEVAWYSGNSRGRSHTVGRKRPNAYGLCDMHGNVWEWCRDWYGYYCGDETDPTGPPTGAGRIFRGGSWYDSAARCRAAYRSYASPGNRSFDVGFRIALVPVR